MKIKYISIEYAIFIILIFLQNFSIITTKEFGIAGITVFLIIEVIIKKLYKKIKIRYLFLALIVILSILISSYINNVYYFSQILRIIMTLLIIYFAYLYIQEILKNEERTKIFWKIYTNIGFFFLLYGIYELLAIKYRLPLFLNIFSNNTSYAPRGLYAYYGGWNEKYRLYSTFFEPSVYSLFLVYNFFILIENKYVNKKKKNIMLLLILFNLFFTYARTGWVTMIYMIGIYIAYDKLSLGKLGVLDKILVFLPFINLAIMYAWGLAFYTDWSSQARTYSAVYYLTQSLSSIKYMLFGHGIGSIINNTNVTTVIEPAAHNGYIDIAYQLGWPILICILINVYNYIKNIKGKNRKIVVGIICTMCCFGVYYMVETLIVLAIVEIVFAINENNRKEIKDDSIKN